MLIIGLSRVAGMVSIGADDDGVAMTVEEGWSALANARRMACNVLTGSPVPRFEDVPESRKNPAVGYATPIRACGCLSIFHDKLSGTRWSNQKRATPRER